MTDALWPLVAGGALWVVREAVAAYFAHQLALKAATENDRLAKLEKEVQMLVQAQNVRGMR